MPPTDEANDIYQRIKHALEGATDGIWDWELSSNEVYFSPSWKAMIGFQPEELENSFETWKTKVHPDDIDAALIAIDQYLSGDTERYEIEFRMQHKDGHFVDILSRGKLIRDDQGNPARLVGTHVDMSSHKKTERLLRDKYEELELVNSKLKEAQAQLIQSEKMVSIGQLTAGIAHEINNPIGFVKSNFNTIKTYVNDLIKILDDNKQDIRNWSELEDDYSFLIEDFNDIFDETQDGMERVIQIVKDLKDFAHPEETEWQFADIEKGIDSTLNIVNNEIKYKAKVVKEYGHIPELQCMPSQLNQVFMNILVNAAHAIPEQGTITIRTGVEEPYAWIEIEDNGSGIPEALRERIFEPFFTTKELGKGTGLGLAISYKIIKKHHGSIKVHSEAGKGTRFKIMLPLNRTHVEDEVA